jgi:hypothetical protein
VQSSGFLASYTPAQSVIYMSNMANFVPQFTALRGDIQTKSIQGYEDVGKGYTLISEGDTVTGTITTDHYGFVYYETIKLRDFPKNSHIYHNGKEKINIK